MTIRYACFISYPYSQSPVMKAFIEQLTLALEERLSLLNTETLIEKDHLRPGHNYNEELAQAICESACMIVIYSPLYENYPKCLQEFMAMEGLERKRKLMLGKKYDSTHRMIIPIIIKGGLEEIPPKIKNIRYIDLSKLLLIGTSKLIKNIEFHNIIGGLASQIYRHYSNLKHLDKKINIDCKLFKIPTEEEAAQWWGKPTRSRILDFPGG